MSDTPDDDRIRALLAELGSGPDGDELPAPVAARLDDTLARLVAERSAPADQTVVPLRRRRAWAGAVAAAVIVLGAGGVAATQLDGRGSGSSDSSSSSAGGGAALPAEGDSPTSGAESFSGGATGALPQVAAGSFTSDVRALLADDAALRLAAPAPGSTPKTPERATARDRASAAPATACPGPRITDGAVPTTVLYDGARAVLVVHPLTGDRRLVEAWDCAGTRRLDTTTLTR